MRSTWQGGVLYLFLTRMESISWVIFANAHEHCIHASRMLLFSYKNLFLILIILNNKSLVLNPFRLLLCSLANCQLLIEITIAEWLVGAASGVGLFKYNASQLPLKLNFNCCEHNVTQIMIKYFRVNHRHCNRTAYF